MRACVGGAGVRGARDGSTVDLVHPHLAQYNIATLRHPLDHPDTASFVALLDEVNAAAEASPGFVWRHGIDSRDPGTSVYDDPLVLVNASVWESFDHLRDYAYRGIHRDVFRRRQEWFDSSGSVMWFVPQGTIPTLGECVERLEFLRRHGPTPYGFSTGQRTEQLVVIAADHTDPVVRSLTAGRHGEGAVHVAVLEGRLLGASQCVDDEVSVWTAPSPPSWLDAALRTHARISPAA